MESGGERRLTVEQCRGTESESDVMAREVRQGLRAEPKWLPCKYFYDERGADLFEQITQLPEYYQTRTELEILQSIADRVIGEFRFEELIEIGSGSSTKTQTLLDAMARLGCLVRYVPLDISEAMLRECSLALLTRYPTLHVHALAGDFLQHLGQVPPAAGRRLVIFLGSTIGNLDVDERTPFLQNVRSLLREEDAFLLGLDLVKDVQRLEDAYNDRAGVTAEFNRNILRAINRGLGANFDVEAYRHYAFYNQEEARIEMHLVPDAPQTVFLARIALTIDIEKGETIRSEISCKFTRESAREMLASAGFRLDGWYTDPGDLFGLALARPL